MVETGAYCYDPCTDLIMGNSKSGDLGRGLGMC